MRSLVLFVLICEVYSSPANWWSYTMTPKPPLNLPKPSTIPTVPPTPGNPHSNAPSFQKGSVDQTPQFLSNNYIPAAMHVLFHLSDSMKYVVKPPSTPSGDSMVTSTTVRPTVPHKPGNYAPDRPGKTWWSYNPESGVLRFEWGKSQVSVTPEQTSVSPPIRQKLNFSEDLDLLGAGPFELLHQINNLEDTDTVDDDDVQIERFVINYEDSVNLEFLRQKRVPPTKAFVNVLSLFDLLNKESKELGLNKYNGYSENMLKELTKTSERTSSEQLKFVLTKIVDKKNTRKDSILRKIKQMLVDLDKPDSYMNMAIKDIPPLQFSL